MSHTANLGNLQWLLDDLVTRVPEAQQAIVLSEDGLLIAASAGMDQEDAERLAAVSSGFRSLSRGVGRIFEGGPVRQTIVEMESAFLFVTSAGQQACLAVIGSSESDIGLIAYEMAVLVRRVGATFSTSPRRAQQTESV